MYEGIVERVMDFSDDELTARFRELELQRRAVEAEMAAIVREGDRRSIHYRDGHRTIRHWVRAQINCSAADASRLRRLSVACDTVPGVGDALADGHIGGAQAHELARLSAHPRVGEMFPASAALLTELAERLSFEEFRVAARRWESLADLDGAERNDEVSAARRTATVVPTAGGIDVRATGGSGFVAAELTSIFARFVQTEFDADVAARSAEFGPDAPASRLRRTDAQRRFDALAAIFRAAAVAPADGIAPTPVVNLLVGEQTLERLIAWRLTGEDPGAGESTDLDLERMETDTGVSVAPTDVVRAAILGHVRRVVVDSAGVVVDAGRKRRLFTGVAREMALLLAHSCDHLGCTVPASQCAVDHVEEWTRDGGATDQVNGRPRCDPHNADKSARRRRTVRDIHGRPVDLRADDTPMVPVGRRVDLPPVDPPDDAADRAPDVSTVDTDEFDWHQFDWHRRTTAAPNAPPGFAEYWRARTTRTEYCRLRTD
jgi:hypothetical protein